MNYYLDSNIFIYAILDTGEKGGLAGKILNSMQDGKFKGMTSHISFEETVFVVWKEKGKKQAISAGENLLSLHNLEIINSSREIMAETIECIKETGLKPRDSMHLAAMKSKSITEMLTEDTDFQKAKSIIKYTIMEFLKKTPKTN